MRNITLAILSILVAASVSAAQLVIPAAGSGPGANDSLWQSDVTIHNVGTTTANLAITLHRTQGPTSAHTLSIAPRETVTLDDIVQKTFGIEIGSGAIVIDGDEFALRKLSVTSRTYNRSDAGEFGQDIPAWSLNQAASEGDTAVINGPVDSATARFNFGIYAIDDTKVDWMLVRRDGSTAATVPASYDAGTQIQYNQGIPLFLGVENENDDVIYARVREGRAFIYGSIVQNSTNDPSFVPFVATRENFAAQLLGVDLDEDGTIDIADANGDGVLDGEVPIQTLGYPNFFRIVVADPEGNEVELELIDASNDVRLLENGTVQWLPPGMFRGTSGALKVQASDGFATTQFLIPVIFQ